MKKRILPKELRVAIYARSSDSDEALSLESQVTICKEHALLSAAIKKTEIIITHVLVEKVGSSGKDSNRPKYQELLYLIRAGFIDWVFAKELSRLSRNIGDFHNFMVLCQEHDVAIFIPGLDIDLNSPTGKIIVQILAVFAQFERELVVARTRSAIRAHVLATAKIHGQPVLLGFRQSPTESGVWFPIEEEIQTVISIFQTFAKYKSYKNTIDLITKLGIRTKKGNDFNFQSLRRLLTNRKYIGKLRVPGEETEVDLPFGIVVPIDLFSTVQSIIESIDDNMRGKTRNPSQVYLLSGLLFSSSGHPFNGTSAHGRNGNRRFYYRNYEDDITFSCDAIETAVIRAVEHICKNEGILEYKEEVCNSNEDQAIALRRSIQATTKVIDRLTSLKSKSLDSLLIDPSSIILKEIEQRILSINSQMEEHSQKRNQLVLQLDELTSAVESIQSIEQEVKNNDVLNKDNTDRKAIRGWLRGLFHKVVVDLETQKLKIYWNYEITGGKQLLPYKADIPVGSRRQMIKTTLDITKEEIQESILLELAVEKRLTSTQIAKELNVSRSTISKYLKKLGISTLQVGSNKKRVRGVRFGTKILSNGKVVSISEEQKTITAIKTWRDQGKSFREIAGILNVQGIPTKTGKGQWHGKTIHQLLSP